jgi:predicted RNase H-like HicB family nuclease
VGSSPGLFFGGCHGNDEIEVFSGAVPNRRGDGRIVPSGRETTAAADSGEGLCKQDAECGMSDSARYIKIVGWSDEDQCFVGQCPGVVGPCCHGDNEAEVYAELCEIVEEWLATLKQDGKPLPPSTAGRGLGEGIA